MPKPKGMWWTNYYHLQTRAQAVERRSDDDFLVMARWLLKGSVMQTLARSGSTKPGPFHGLRRYPTHEAGSQHYEVIANIEHASLQTNK